MSRRTVNNKKARLGQRRHRRWASSLVDNRAESKFIERMNEASQGVLVQGYDRKPLYANKSYAETLGYTVPQLLSLQSVDELYPLEEVQRMRTYFKNRLLKAARNSPPSIYQVAAKHKNGNRVILQNSVTLIEWAGRPAVMVTTMDLTSRYLAQQALELSEERFRDFAESASDWCWEMDANFCFTFVSTTFERITGCSAERVLGLSRDEFMLLNHPSVHLDDKEREKWIQHNSQLAQRLPYTGFEYSWYKPDGSIVIVSSSGKPVLDNQGTFLGYRGTATDVTEARLLSEKLTYQASHDSLTGLINRRHFDLKLQSAIEDARTNHVEHALVFMDLDRFKIVNDTCGHPAGDELLVQLSDLFLQVFSRRDVLARLGGDEFAVIMHHCTTEQSTRITKQLHDEINRFRFVWQDKSFAIGVSIGVAAINENSENASRLLQNVDAACYLAKENGRNKTHIFAEDDKDVSRRQGEMYWAGRITQALQQDEFTLEVQPIVPSDNTGDIFYELLIRLRNEDQALIFPDTFLPAAERYDLSLNVDKWVLTSALQWLDKHRITMSEVSLFFINLSGKTIGKKAFYEYVIDSLKMYQIPPERICFEITETTAIANLGEAIRFMKRLKAVGCSFALDDFGSGVSSFAYLKNLPVDYLKIDGMFVRDIHENAVNLAMVKSINEISHVMGKKTIAEFVENDTTLALLRNLGVDYAQGYAIDRPFPLENLSSKIRLGQSNR